jgi:hypothetical protein
VSRNRHLRGDLGQPATCLLRGCRLRAGLSAPPARRGRKRRLTTALTDPGSQACAGDTLPTSTQREGSLRWSPPPLLVAARTRAARQAPGQRGAATAPPAALAVVAHPVLTGGAVLAYAPRVLGRVTSGGSV